MAIKKHLNLFVQLAKIDEARHEVWGVATAEIVDKDGEIFDYATSKPYFKAWSDEIAKATDGKSLGNVREMHEPSAVGKLIAIDFDDELKQINVGAKIVDAEAWQKCAQGVYTGFSIGGTYVKAWKDGEFVRFTANPSEISVVDNPCVPSAHFTAVKADGSFEVRKFKSAAETQDVAKVGARLSRETLAHLHAIEKCLMQILNQHHEAAAHLNALLAKDEGGEAMAAMAGHKKASGGQRPEIEMGEQTMFDARDQEQVEKAFAGPASALSKLAEVEQKVASLRSEMETNNREIQQALGNLMSLVEKLVAPQESGGRVARTAVPAHTVTKEDDARRGLAKQAGEASVHDLLKKSLQNPQPASFYLR
ncbi:MAG TPA: hypothetical protein VEW69_06395 [Alphaproteobacteria bacterium]|nr:hypothetical protein [Alphaproteobacteria bacterium]